jgi:excisionase family DNA binding protein
MERGDTATDGYMKVRDVARVLAVSRATAYRLVASRAIPSIWIGSTVRVPRAGFQAWLDAQAINQVQL